MPSILSQIKSATSKIVKSGNAVLNIETPSGKEKFQCQFNPEEYNLKVQGKYTTLERSQNNSPIMQYIGGDADSLDLSLFLDTSEAEDLDFTGANSVVGALNTEDVTKYTKKLVSMIRMNGKLHRPPVVEFSWGSLSFSGFVDNIGVQYTMFESGGKPIRAKVTLHMQAGGGSGGNPIGNPLQSPDRTKCRMLTADNNIWTLAYQEYGSTREWRRIAEANHIMDPLRIPEGTMLVLPPLVE